MCGILGIQFDKNLYHHDDIKFRISKMMEVNRYRGRDYEGFNQYDQTFLGMSRLAIFDNKSYPLPVESKNSVITYNGEIYDFNQQIETDFSKSDTGALLNYLEKKKDIEYLNGMFAFGFYEKESKELFLARDRSGEKPLYFYQKKGLFIFASDIKSILAGLSKKEYPKLLENEDIKFFELNCFSNTPFKDIYALKPGNLMKVKNASIKFNSTYLSSKTTEKSVGKDWKDEMKFLIKDAVEIRCKNRSGKIATALSGGLDSSIVTALAKPDFSVLGEYSLKGFTEGKEVHNFAKDIKVNLKVFRPKKSQFNKIFSKIPFLMDTPATWTSFNLFLLYKKVSDNGARICLSGEGADELFGGYARYRLIYYLNQIFADKVLKNRYEPLIENIFGTKKNAYLKITNRSKLSINNFKKVSKFYDNVFNKKLGLLSKLGMIDFCTSMQILLQMPDRIGMFHEVESRAPFLDYRLISFAKSLPDELKISEEMSKVALRKIAQDLIPSYKSESFKKGFAVPYNVWFADGGFSREKYNDEYLKLWNKSFKNYSSFMRSLSEFKNEF
tara:strand:+ start:8131 stop:9798 length:1668 start_codon:yes stop_codon:yes gene_type:complete